MISDERTRELSLCYIVKKEHDPLRNFSFCFSDFTKKLGSPNWGQSEILIRRYRFSQDSWTFLGLPIGKFEVGVQVGE